MQARRDASLAQAKLLKSNKERQVAMKKAQDIYKAEMKVAAKQLEAAKALCKKSTSKPAKKATPPGLEKKSLDLPLKPLVEKPKPPAEVPKPAVETPKQSTISVDPATVKSPLVEKPLAPTIVNVEISNFAFSPTTIKINKGDTVVWTNKDGASHTVTSDTNAFSSNFLGTNQSFKFTFDKTGSFQYHCQPHRNMIATVEVVE